MIRALFPIAACMVAVAPSVARADDELTELIQALSQAAAASSSAPAGASALERLPKAPVGGEGSEPCASGGGDDLVLRLGRACSVERLAGLVRAAVTGMEHAAQARAVRVGCGPIDRCRERRASFEKLQRYSSNQFERQQVGGPRYVGDR